MHARAAKRMLDREQHVAPGQLDALAEPRGPSLGAAKRDGVGPGEAGTGRSAATVHADQVADSGKRGGIQ